MEQCTNSLPILVLGLLCDQLNRVRSEMVRLVIFTKARPLALEQFMVVSLAPDPFTTSPSSQLNGVLYMLPRFCVRWKVPGPIKNWVELVMVQLVKA